jgi:hypothetical protein
VRKVAKDLTPDERSKESEKRAGRRVAIRNRQNAARLDEEHRQETEWFLAAHALANSEELAGKAVVRVVMMMKQEAINVASGGVASLPPSCAVGGALSTFSVTSTPSGRPPALDLNMPVLHVPALDAHGRGGVLLSRFGDLQPPSGSAGLGIDLNHTPSTGCGTLAGLKKAHRMSTADMPRAVNLFDEMLAPTEEVMAHPSCQLALPVA